MIIRTFPAQPPLSFRRVDVRQVDRFDGVRRPPWAAMHYGPIWHYLSLLGISRHSPLASHVARASTSCSSGFQFHARSRAKPCETCSLVVSSLFSPLSVPSYQAERER